MEASTIKMAIEKGNHIKNACWANALYDFYGNTIMSEKTRKRLTIERIIEITGRQDFYENGLSINDMDKVFKEFKIPARIYNFLTNSFINIHHLIKIGTSNLSMLLLRVVIYM